MTNPLSNLTDLEHWLVDRARAQDPSAWEDLIARFEGRLFAFVKSRINDRTQAEDLVQETAANLYLAWDRLDASGAVDAYARTTLVNQARKLWRRPWWKRERTVERLPEPIPAEPRSSAIRTAAPSPCCTPAATRWPPAS